jgi:hypothetical protein
VGRHALPCPVVAGAHPLDPACGRRFRLDRPPLALNALRQTGVAKGARAPCRDCRAAAFTARLRQISDRAADLHRSDELVVVGIALGPPASEIRVGAVRRLAGPVAWPTSSARFDGPGDPMQDLGVMGFNVTAAAKAATGSDPKVAANSAESGSDMAGEPTSGFRS